MKAHRPLTRQTPGLAPLALSLALGSLGPACVERADDLGATGSETHFLLECSESCAAGLDCIGGVCTRACSEDAVCTSFSAAAVCTAEPGSAEPGACDVQCSVAADCAAIGVGYRCLDGSCRSAMPASGESTADDLPPFDVLELRRLIDDQPAAGSSCDPRDFAGAYFVDLPARQVSWSYCEDDARDRVYRSSTGQW